MKYQSIEIPDDKFCRDTRTEPLTKAEFVQLCCLLTKTELQAAIERMSDEHQTMLGRQLVNQQCLN